MFHNPLGLSTPTWVAAYVGITGLKLLTDFVVLAIVDLLGTKNMPSRARAREKSEAKSNDKVKQHMLEIPGAGLPDWLELGRTDKAYMLVNSVIEFVFTQHFILFAMHSPLVQRNFSQLGLLNTIPALFLLFAMDDFFYAPCHMVMHWRPLYPLIHKHHHKQVQVEACFNAVLTFSGHNPSNTSTVLFDVTITYCFR